VKVRVDRPRCEAHGQCNLVSEALFPLDDDGFSAIGDAGISVPPDDEDVAQEGVYNCPVQALSLES
jgi:ferredoxin